MVSLLHVDVLMLKLPLTKPPLMTLAVDRSHGGVLALFLLVGTHKWNEATINLTVSAARKVFIAKHLSISVDQ